MNKTDMQLKTDVESELRWDPRVNAAQIGVSVDKGAVSLMGTVDSYAAKWAAEDAVKRVSGVRTVAQDLTVKVLGEHKHSDSEIAAAVQAAFKWDVYIPSTITAKVQAGAVTLEGKAEWHYQRDAAARAVRNLTGVVSVSNLVTLTPQPGATVSQVKEKVEAALVRHAHDNAKAIHIEATGGKVTLTGPAQSWANMGDARMAAWSTPGVTDVIDHMTLS